jgi:hypothetical protein
MPQSITDVFNCNRCVALYDSERELRDHQEAAYHAVSSGARRMNI